MKKKTVQQSDRVRVSLRHLAKIAVILSATEAKDDESSMYKNVAAILADVETMALRCGTMGDGQIDQEIIGTTVCCDGGRCIIGERTPAALQGCPMQAKARNYHEGEVCD